MVSTFAERFKEQGLQQGLDRGKQQGEAAMLLRRLERKFGAAALAPYRMRVERADPDTLLVWSERILTASSIENVKDYPLTRLSSTTASETAKVLENSYRAVKIFPSSPSGRAMPSRWASTCSRWSRPSRCGPPTATSATPGWGLAATA